MKKFTALLLAAVLMLALSGCTIETLGEWGGLPGMKAGETSAPDKTEEPSKQEDAEEPQTGDETGDPEETETNGETTGETEETDGSDETGGNGETGADETEGSAEESAEETEEQSESAEEPAGPSDEEVYAAFADVIAELEDQCGEGEIREPEEEEDPRMLWVSQSSV